MGLSTHEPVDRVKFKLQNREYCRAFGSVSVAFVQPSFRNAENGENLILAVSSKFEDAACFSQ